MSETTPEKVKVGAKGKKGCYSSFFSFLLVLLIPVLLLGGYWAQRAGFEKIRQMRQLERIPHVEAVALIEGEVTMTGHALDGGEMVDGKYTEVRSYYLYWLEEEYVEDDDGGGSWQTRDSGTRHVPSFLMEDATGNVLVSLESLVRSRERPRLNLDHRHRRGDYRFSEYRLDPGDRLFAFAKAELLSDPGQKKDEVDYRLNFDAKGSFTPVLSQGATATSVRSGQGTGGVLLSVGSLAAFAFGIMLLCFKLRIHRLLVFLSLLSGLNLCVLLMMGLKMMSADLKDGKDRLSRHARSATAAVEKELDLEAGSFRWEGSLQGLKSQEEE
ncbi:MAG: hypothetical protein VYC95_03090, partial [Verrucomicrobiota bacterium]|nr:hypothetical protein [Verrucomicrobiota bacterium]